MSATSYGMNKKYIKTALSGIIALTLVISPFNYVNAGFMNWIKSAVNGPDKARSITGPNDIFLNPEMAFAVKVAEEKKAGQLEVIQGTSLVQTSSPFDVNLFQKISYISGYSLEVAEELSEKPMLTLEGEASYYSWDGCLGCNSLRRMANGQILNDYGLTMAIGANRKHLVGRYAKVTNLSSGKSVVVEITDTGGFYQERYSRRVADLTIGTKNAIGMEGGLAYVRVEVY